MCSRYFNSNWTNQKYTFTFAERSQPAIMQKIHSSLLGIGKYSSLGIGEQFYERSRRIYCKIQLGYHTVQIAYILHTLVIIVNNNLDIYI